MALGVKQAAAAGYNVEMKTEFKFGRDALIMRLQFRFIMFAQIRTAPARLTVGHGRRGFRSFFDNAGLNINAEINEIAVPGHIFDVNGQL